MTADSDSPFGPEWMVVTDAATILGQSDRTVRRRFSQGLLEGRREGNRPNGRLWVRIPPEVWSQPTTQVAAARIEVGDLKRDLEETKAWGAEQARLLADAEQRAEAARQARKDASEDARAASIRHSLERKALEGDIERIRLEVEEWQRRSDALEQERDRYLERYQSANGEVESLRKAGRGHSARVSAFQQQERTQSAEIRRLQDETTRLQVEPAGLQAQIDEKNVYIDKCEAKVNHYQEFGPRMILISASAGASACIFGVALYVLLRAPAALILLAS